MKRMIAFIFILFALFGVAVIKVNMPKVLDYDRVIIISNKKLNYSNIKNGNDFYYTFDKNQTKELKEINICDIKGMVFYISKQYSIDNFQKQFNFLITNKSKIDEKDVYYGYDKNYHDFRIIDGKKINFQLVKSEDNWILGYPMIMTGF